MRKAGILYIIILAVLAGALIFTGKPWLGIVFSVLAVYLLLALLLLLVQGRRLSLQLSAQAEAEKGEEAAVSLTAANASLFPVARCDLTLEMKNRLNGSTACEALRFGVFPKKKEMQELKAAAPYAGLLEIRAAEGWLLDPLGLLAKRIRTLPEPAQVLVLPQLSPVPLSAQVFEHYDMESFRYADGRVGGDSSETVGIRAYRAGDSIRAMHWKLSAKQGEPVVREYGFPVDNRLMVLADKRMPEPEGYDSLFVAADALCEYALSASLTLAEHALSHTLGWYDRGTERFITKEVHSRENLLQLLSDFLGAPFYEAQEGAAQYFLEADLEKRYAGYLYITGTEAEDAGMQKLKELGDVIVLTLERQKIQD